MSFQQPHAEQKQRGNSKYYKNRVERFSKLQQREVADRKRRHSAGRRGLTKRIRPNQRDGQKQNVIITWKIKFRAIHAQLSYTNETLDMQVKLKLATPGLSRSAHVCNAEDVFCSFFSG